MLDNRKITSRIDWLLFFFLLPILAAGLITMHSFLPAVDNGGINFFSRQLIWIALSFLVFFGFSFVDFRFLRLSNILVISYLIFAVLLLLLFLFGTTIQGATSWFNFGGFSFQPADFMKLILVLILAKYFSHRHVEIANVKHIFISGLYALIPFILIFLQPDFGSAIVIFLVWLGMTMISGISKKHLFLVLAIGTIAFLLTWSFALEPYQKRRIESFIHPLTDPYGAGYNARQAVIAVGSGQFLGKGVGYGTQSRLRFLPEFESDFIFAAFAEEWGFVGGILLLALFGLVIWRILANALLGVTNFEILFGIGVAILFMSHVTINIGMNLGLMPVTGITLPFMSYGGSHLLTEFAALGILMGMRRYQRVVHREDLEHEFLGI